MKNTYLIFPDHQDVHNYLTITCTKEDLKNGLVEAEVMNEMEEISDFNWVIFENGTLIQG